MSDIHIRDNTVVGDDFLDPIVCSLTEFESINEVVIIMSGDIAFSGKKEEYEHAKHFLGKIITKIKKQFFSEYKKINVFIVPGNHDYKFDVSHRNRGEIANILKNKDIKYLISKELAAMNNFFAFAKINNCFINDKIIDIKQLRFGNYTIQINLINSSLFSALNDENGDNEMGLHYIPESLGDRLKKKSDSSICFSIMHHGSEWFDMRSRKIIETYIMDNSSILFVGHDHVPESVFKKINNNKESIILRGGVLNDNSINNEFNAVILNTDNNEIETYSLTYDDNRVYIINKLDKRKIANSLNFEGINLKKEYHDSLIQSGFNGSCSEELFVFPYLEEISIDGYNSNNRVETCEKFINEIHNKKLCVIKGNDLSGKTQLLQHLFVKSFNCGLPLFIDADNIRNDSLDKIIQNAFQQQYSDDFGLYKKYVQMDISKKVIFVDNLNKIKDSCSFVNELIKRSRIVIATTTLDANYDIKEATLSQFKDEAEVARYNIEPFYLEKRKELIYKACKSLYNGFQESAINEKVKEINDFIMEQIRIFNIHPYFILSYCNSFSKRTKGDGNKMNTFGEVFRANMVIAFERISTIRVDTAFFILERIAYNILATKRYPLELNVFNDLVIQYNKEFAQKISPINFLNDLVNAKIIKYYDEQTIKFYSDSILAYFAGKKISDISNLKDGQDIIKYLIKNICFGINGEILRFIITLRNDNELLQTILLETAQYTDDWNEFSFAEGNISFLNNKVKRLSLSRPTHTEKDKDIKRIESQERGIVKKFIETINIFDYTDDDLNKFVNKQIRAHKISILISSLYSTFYHIIKAENKDSFLKAIYQQPNKIIYYMLKPFSDDFEQVINEIYEDMHSTQTNITKEMISNSLISIATTIILNVYNNSARQVGTPETIEGLINYAEHSNNINYKLQLVMILENMGNLQAFGKRAESIDDNTKIDVISDMIKRIVYKHYTWNNVPLVGYGQHLAAKYFNNSTAALNAIQKRSMRKKK